MKVSIINTLYYPNQIGGAEKSVQSLAEKFHSLGYNVMVITLGKEDLYYNINGVEIHCLKLNNSYWPFDNENKTKYQKLLWHINDINNNGYTQKLTQILKDYNPNILLTNNIAGFSVKVWEISKKLNIKTVHILRDYYLQCPKSTKYKNNHNCKKLCFDCNLFSLKKKQETKKVDYLIGISNFIIKDHLNQGFFKGINTKTIYNGFNLKTTNKVKKKIGKEVVFGFIGQINKTKGIELLLKVFSSLKEGWKLHVAGKISDDYINELKKINNSNNIIFLGYQPTNTFFEKIDILLVPSLWNEPFGRVVLEAIINKKPVIASNLGGLTELLSNNKAFIVEPTVNGFLEKIKTIISDHNYISEFVYDDHNLEAFSIDNTVKQYIKVFNEILESDET